MLMINAPHNVFPHLWLHIHVKGFQASVRKDLIVADPFLWRKGIASRFTVFWLRPIGGACVPIPG